MKFFNAIQVVLAFVMLLCDVAIIVASLMKSIFHPLLLVWVAMGAMAIYLIKQQIKIYKDEQE